MVDEVWTTPGEAAKHFGVTTQALRDWARDDRIKHKRTSGGHIRYSIPVLQQPDTDKTGFIYARVSSYKQRSDLCRQIDSLRSRFPHYTVISDIGSGVNFQRKGLHTLLDKCMCGVVSEVVVAYRDRLARIGYGLIEHIIRRSGSLLTVIEDPSCDGCPSELAEDVMAVLTHFTAKSHGKRAHKNKESTALPNKRAEAAVPTDVRSASRNVE